MLNGVFTENGTQKSGRKFLSSLAVVGLSVLCAITVVLAALITLMATSDLSENTFQFMEYKFFCVAEDIDDTNIKGGSLIVVRDTENDEFYTPESLSENTVLVIENLGFALKNDAIWIALCFMVPTALICALCLASELRKRLFAREEERLSSEYVIEQNNEIEEMINM